MNAAQQPILVWDLPTRAFHWMLAAAFAGAYLSGEARGWIVEHALFGYTMLGLVAFRLAWGFLGTRYARFSAFAYGAKAVAEYLRTLRGPAPRHYLGHNPAGAWAIFALLTLAALAGATGWLALLEFGGRAMREVHEFFANLMLGMVLLHIGGALVASYLHRENLPRAMIDGYKAGAPEEGLRGSVWIVGVALIAAVAAFWAAALHGDLPLVTQAAVERQQLRLRQRSEAVRPGATAVPATRTEGTRSPPAPR